MNKSNRKILVLSLVLVLAACATIEPLTPAGTRVLQISETTAKSCEFLQVAQFTTTLHGMGKDPAIVQTTGENGLHNAVAATGGNAYVLRTDNADWFWGHVAYSGDAYKCPDSVMKPKY